MLRILPFFITCQLWKLAFFLLAFILPAMPLHAQKINLIFPPDSARLASSDSIFVFGNVDVDAKKIIINGLRARQFENHTFVAMVPVVPGALPIQVSAIFGDDTSSVQRSVWVPPYFIETSHNNFEIDTSYFQTYKNQVLQPGDMLTLIMKATPGQRVYYEIPGILNLQRMYEVHPRRRPNWKGQLFLSGKQAALPAIRGLYHATLRVEKNFPAGEFGIRFFMRSSRGDTIRARPRHALFVRNANELNLAKIGMAAIVVDESGEKPVSIYFDEGASVMITGRSGDDVRVRLAPTRQVWIDERFIRSAPDSMSQKAASIRFSGVDSTTHSVQFKFNLSHRVPLQFEQNHDPEALILDFFNAYYLAETAASLPATNAARMTSVQQMGESVRFSFRIAGLQQSGYRRFYEDSLFVVEIMRNPFTAAKNESPLKKLTILLDAGHGPDTGSIGPTGLQEQYATAQATAVLEKMLLKQGAIVVLTRTSATGLNLASRTLFADAIDADLLISLHFNALPASVNPLRSRGTSSYFYHAHSEDLASALQARLLQASRLRDFGVHQRDLSVCRISSMPAVLLEPAFIMIPSEERKISDPAFIERICQGIVAGLSDFIQTVQN